MSKTNQNGTLAKKVCVAGMNVKASAAPNPGITAAYIQFREELKKNAYFFSPAPGKTSHRRLPGRFLPR